MSKIKIEVPEYMKECPQLMGVCIGYCVVTGKWTKGIRLKDNKGNYLKNAEGKFLRLPPHAAHAHTGGDGKGWICFRTMADFEKETTCKHELAHIITEEGHTRKWAEKYVELIADNPKKAKWLTVEWLQRKYKFE